MSTEKVVYPQAERQRVLQNIAYLPNTVLSRDLPKDTVLKRLQLRLSGAVTTTFVSGTPVSDTQSIFSNLIPRIDVVIGGSRVVKSVVAHMMRVQQLYYSNTLGERRSSAAASSPNQNNFSVVDGGFVFGTTGQVSIANETILLPFEHMFSDPSLGRETTWLNLKGVSSAELRLTAGSFAALQGFGNTAPVVYTANTFIVDIITTEAQDVPSNILFKDWKQTTKSVSYASQTANSLVDLNRGNQLSALMFFVQDGSSGSATTASGKLPSNLALQKIQLVLNGQTQIKTTTFQALQAENKSSMGINAPMASGVSLLDGYAYLNLLARRDLTTALNVAPPLVDNVQVALDTNNATDTSYTNPITVTIMTDEIVVPR